MSTKPKSTVFDYERYGVFLRSARQRAGYNRAEEFCQIVSDWLGVKINKEALYRIEKGVQAPTVEQLLAFGIILYRGKGISNVISKTDLHHCITPYAEHAAEFQGDIETLMTYDGYYALPRHFSNEACEWLPASPQDPNCGIIDEYYLDALEKQRELDLEVSPCDSNSLPDNVVCIDGINVCLD